MPEHGTYLGNPLLKAAHIQQDWTEEQVGQYVRCQQDPLYFVTNFIKIVSVDEGLIEFDVRDYQEDMIDKFHNERFQRKCFSCNSCKQEDYCNGTSWKIATCIRTYAEMVTTRNSDMEQRKH